MLTQENRTLFVQQIRRIDGCQAPGLPADVKQVRSHGGPREVRRLRDWRILVFRFQQHSFHLELMQQRATQKEQ